MGYFQISDDLLRKTTKVLMNLTFEVDIFLVSTISGDTNMQLEHEKTDGRYLEIIISADKITCFTIDSKGNECNYDISEIKQINEIFDDIFK
jgi:hypothetical protein